MTSIDLHFVCKKQKNWTKLDANMFETGNWKVGNKAANEAIGGRVYLHERQNDIAWHGGTIIEWRLLSNSTRKIFTYRLDGNFDVRCTSGWGNEKAIVRR